MAVEQTLERNQLILKRVKELRTKFLDQYDYVDLHSLGIYYDKETESNEIAVFKDKALINTVKMWMLSKKGDYYREPLRGGVIELLLGSPMTPQRASEIRSQIIDKFRIDFSLVELVQLTIDMDVKLKIWKVKYEVLDIINKKLVNFSVNVQV